MQGDGMAIVRELHSLGATHVRVDAMGGIDVDFPMRVPEIPEPRKRAQERSPDDEAKEYERIALGSAGAGVDGDDDA